MNFDSIENNEDTYIQKILEQRRKDFDEAIFKFLRSNGYDIQKPYDVKRIKEIKLELEKQDKFVDVLEYTDIDYKRCVATYYYMPFFNSISHPLSNANREFLLEEWKKKNASEKIEGGN